MTLKLAPSVLIATLLQAANLHAGTPPFAAKPLPTILIEASYPGAGAADVADNVAAPIEQQVRGVENIRHLISRCTSDGGYLLAVTFKPGTDLDQASVLVQNRLAVAQATLPEEVKRAGITLRKKFPLQMIVALTAAGDRFDALYLSNYANTHVKDDLARVAGVGEVAAFGQRDYSIRVWLNPEKLAPRSLSPQDVIDALRQHDNRQVPAGRVGQPPTGKSDFQLKLDGAGRLGDPEQIADIILKTDDKGGRIRLRDVANVELGAAGVDRCVTLNGKPGVLLCIHPTSAARPKELRRAVADRIAKLSARAPEGLHVELAFDFTANADAAGRPESAELLLLDLHLPDDASRERMQKSLKHCDTVLRAIAGVQDVLALTENPFDILQTQPCMLVRLASPDKRKVTRAEIIRTIRASMEKTPDVVVRLRDLSRLDGFAHCDYPIELAVTGPDTDKLRGLAYKLADRLKGSKKLTDVWASRDSLPCPSFCINVDRAKALMLGLSMREVYDAVQLHLGSVHVSDFNRFGRTWQVVVQTDDKLRKRAQDLANLKIRSREGKLIPLGRIAELKSIDVPAAVVRLDLQPMVAITANLAPGLTLAEARKLCGREFAQLLEDSRLAADYRLTWLGE